MKPRLFHMFQTQDEFFEWLTEVVLETLVSSVNPLASLGKSWLGILPMVE